jgi:hypothetical protein
MTGGPYIAGDNLTISGNVSYTARDAPFDGNVTIDLGHPNGTHRYFKSSVVNAIQSYTQSGTYNQSGFTTPQYINDGFSTTGYAYTSSPSGKYIGVTWSQNRTISRVKTYYYYQYWPTAYKIQVLGEDGKTWIDKKAVTGFMASPITYPSIEDRIPATVTKGVRIYYQTPYSTYIYIYEMWAYGPEEYLVDKILLPISGNYTLNISASDPYGLNGSIFQSGSVSQHSSIK